MAFILQKIYRVYDETTLFSRDCANKDYAVSLVYQLKKKGLDVKDMTGENILNTEFTDNNLGDKKE